MVAPWLHHCKQGSPRYSEKEIMKPDFRNITRGEQWIKSMVEASEQMDRGKKDAMEKAVENMRAPIPKERIPGEDDD